ncbi:4-vinyl reductase [Desulfovibrio sp. OttesenSCG-928-F07]|nr:4-vinyl reductase [Desulfovibrio sp. OttesenSCG-928-F07]
MSNTPNRKYEFSWENTIGANMQVARPSLGPALRIEMYRLMQFGLRDVLEQHYGTEASDKLFREAGQLAGKSFYNKFCLGAKDLNSLVRLLDERFREFGVGILRMEQVDLENLTFTMTIDEDLDCSGLPDVADVICVYDEGFLQGILEAFTGKKFAVREVDCWCKGARTCRFEAHGR